MESMQVGTVGQVEEVAVRKGKKSAKVQHHHDPVPQFVAEMTARMPGELERVERDSTPLVQEDVKREPTPVSAYELKIPAKDENGKPIDSCHWVRQQGIVPVRRFVVECVGHPELGVIRTWATGASDAIMLFCQDRKVKNAHMFDFRAVEDPPAKVTVSSNSGSSNAGNTGSRKS